MNYELELLSRIQFGVTIAFHILFPAFSIGLATFLVIMEGCWLYTNQLIYLSICRFWTKIFGLTFGMGVVSGIVMEFQLGTNWAGFAKIAGPVLGSLFTYEVMTAFFIEAGFLGVMVLGWEKVGKKLHYLATSLVFLGVTLSAFWIMSANSWMQTPIGAKFVSDHFIVSSWYHVIFNPSAVPRFIHMMLAAWITTAFVISGISAHYLLQNKHTKISKHTLSFVLITLVALVALQFFVGDRVGVIVHKYQPIKSAAIEAIWHTQKGAPLFIFTLPNQKQERNEYSIGVSKLASLINTHQLNGTFIGLTSVPDKDRPFVLLVFFSFRVMVGLGIMMLITVFIGVYLMYRKRLYSSKKYLKLLRLMAPIGFPAIISGWITAEAGRQPWVIYQILRTNEAISSITLKHVITSIILIILVYGIVFGIFYFRYLGKIISEGPMKHEPREVPFSYLAKAEGKQP